MTAFTNRLYERFISPKEKSLMKYENLFYLTRFFAYGVKKDQNPIKITRVKVVNRKGVEVPPTLIFKPTFSMSNIWDVLTFFSVVIIISVTDHEVLSIGSKLFIVSALYFLHLTYEDHLHSRRLLEFRPSPILVYRKFHTDENNTVISAKRGKSCLTDFRRIDSFMSRCMFTVPSLKVIDNLEEFGGEVDRFSPHQRIIIQTEIHAPTGQSWQFSKSYDSFYALSILIKDRYHQQLQLSQPIFNSKSNHRMSKKPHKNDTHAAISNLIIPAIVPFEVIYHEYIQYQQMMDNTNNNTNNPVNSPADEKEITELLNTPSFLVHFQAQVLNFFNTVKQSPILSRDHSILTFLEIYHQYDPTLMVSTSSSALSSPQHTRSTSKDSNKHHHTQNNMTMNDGIAGGNHNNGKVSYYTQFKNSMKMHRSPNVSNSNRKYLNLFSGNNNNSNAPPNAVDDDVRYSEILQRSQTIGGYSPTVVTSKHSKHNKTNNTTTTTNTNLTNNNSNQPTRSISHNQDSSNPGSPTPTPRKEAVVVESLTDLDLSSVRADIGTEIQSMATDSQFDHDLQVRGDYYTTDKKKICAGPAVAELAFSEVYTVDTSIYGDRHDHISQRGRVHQKLQQLRDLEATHNETNNVTKTGTNTSTTRDDSFYFVLNIQIPGDPPISCVYCFRVPPEFFNNTGTVKGIDYSTKGMKAGTKLFQQFIDIPQHNTINASNTTTTPSAPSPVGLATDTDYSDEDIIDEEVDLQQPTNNGLKANAIEVLSTPTSWTQDIVWPDEDLSRGVLRKSSFQSRRFKLVPKMLYGPWIVQMAVRSTPCLLGQKIVQRYFRGEDYLEVDCHVGSSSIATSIVGTCRTYSAQLAINLGVVLQGEDESELPEIVLASVVVNKVDFSYAVPLN